MIPLLIIPVIISVVMISMGIHILRLYSRSKVDKLEVISFLLIGIFAFIMSISAMITVLCK